jgi:hypothetical protein
LGLSSRARNPKRVISTLERRAGPHPIWKLRDSSRPFKGGEGKWTMGADGIRRITPLKRIYIIHTDANPAKPKRLDSSHPP